MFLWLARHTSKSVRGSVGCIRPWYCCPCLDRSYWSWLALDRQAPLTPLAGLPRMTRPLALVAGPNPLVNRTRYAAGLRPPVTSSVERQLSGDSFA